MSTYSDISLVSNNLREQETSVTKQYEQESAQKLEQFKTILARFSKTVQDRQLSQKLGISAKEPEEYTFQDVLTITDKLHQQHKSAADVGGCTGRIRKFFRAVGENRGALNKVLGFVPNDVYGSLICGGFTVILAALSRADTLRKDIYSTLAEIPHMLENIEVLTDIHDGIPRLRLSATSVFLAIFDLLALIIDELSKNVKTKALQTVLRGESYRADIQEAVKSLHTSIAAFKNLSALCDSARLGRVEKSQIRSEEKIEDLHRMIAQFEERLGRNQEAFKSASTDQRVLEFAGTTAATLLIESSSKEYETQRAQIEVEKKLLKVCRGDESPDERGETGPNPFQRSRHDRGLHHDGPKTEGKISESITRQRQAPRRIVTPQRSAKGRGRRAAARWLKGQDFRFEKLAREDLKATTRSDLSLTEQDQAQWILCSDHLLEWLEARSSQVLVVEAETPPDNVLNTLSFSAGFLARCIAASYDEPVLYYSSGLRNEDSPDEKMSGAIALVNSLNAQLVQYLLRATTVDLSFLSDSSYRDSQNNIRHGLRVFRSLAGRLAQGACLFVMIDSLSRLSGLESTGETALKGILRLVDDENITLKVLVTDPLPSTQLRSKNCLWLFVPDEIAGGGHGMDLQFLQDDTRELLIKSDQIRRGDGSSEDSDSVEMSDSSDDDDWD